MVEENCFLQSLYLPHHWILQPCGDPFHPTSSMYETKGTKRRIERELPVIIVQIMVAHVWRGKKNLDLAPGCWMNFREEKQLLWVIFRKRKKANGTRRYIMHKMLNRCFSSHFIQCCSQLVYVLPKRALLFPTKLDLRLCCWKLNSFLCFGLEYLKQECLYTSLPKSILTFLTWLCFLLHVWIFGSWESWM